MTQHKTSQEAALDRLLAAAREVEERPPNDLIRRVLTDAAALQPSAAGRTAQRAGWLRGSQWRLPRLGAFGGLITASAVGFWIGVSPPPVLDGIGVTTGFGALAPLSEDAAEVSGFGWDLEES